jgi:ATP-dependent exoDNAse (exonuclease V) alpha subunit
MLCFVEGFSANGYGGVLHVRTKTGHRLPITMITDIDKCQKVRYFPIRHGYASTIHKAQGGEFKHITVWLDRTGAPAAGYTALSRVEYSENYLLGGHVEREHFVPAM